MEDIYIIISKYLLGTASPQEEKEIMEWRNADAGHEQEFQELCESWQIAHAGIHPVIPDKERVWGKIMSNLNLVKPVKMYTRRLLYRAVGIAAMLALVLGFSLSLTVSHHIKKGLSVQFYRTAVFGIIRRIGQSRTGIQPNFSAIRQTDFSFLANRSCK